jgi:hypothetical protein
MTPSQQFLKFAADCESMAKLTPGPENEPSGAVWRNGGLAVRSGRSAKSLAAQNARLHRRERKRDRQRQSDLDE